MGPYEICKHCKFTFRMHLFQSNACPSDGDIESGRTSGRYLATSFEPQTAETKILEVKS
jgi:hypothetical protein